MAHRDSNPGILLVLPITLEEIQLIAHGKLYFNPRRMHSSSMHHYFQREWLRMIHSLASNDPWKLRRLWCHLPP
jgi:hypothetical protein